MSNQFDFLLSERLREPELVDSEKAQVTNAHRELIDLHLKKDAEEFANTRVQPINELLNDAQESELIDSVLRFGQAPLTIASSPRREFDTTLTLDRFCSLQSFQVYSFGTNSVSEFILPGRFRDNGPSAFARIVEQGNPGNGSFSVAAAIGNLGSDIFEATGDALLVFVTSASASIYKLVPIRGVGRIFVEASADLFNTAFYNYLQVVLLPDEANLPQGLAGARAFIDLDIITPSEVIAASSRQVFLDVASIHKEGGLGTAVSGSFFRQLEPITTSAIMAAESTSNIVVGVTLNVLAVLGAPAGTVNAYAGADFRASSTTSLFPVTQGRPPGAIKVREIRVKTCPADLADPTSTE